MLTHINSSNIIPKRVVILGSGGFISTAIECKLSDYGIDALPISRDKIDLTIPQSIDQLSHLLSSEDILIFVAAKAPVKNENMLFYNLKMVETVCLALKKQKISHMVYISSDAVYSDSYKPINEDSIKIPYNLHGIMHMSRENIINNEINIPMAIVRPTLVYGEKDPHSGYGPNLFYRKIQNNEDIEIFGNGEELRDHVFIDDVAEIICRVILRKSMGNVNAVSGRLITFLEIAEQMISNAKSNSNIIKLKRNGEMPHNGYREFNINVLKNSFPDFEPILPKEGLKKFKYY